MCHMYPFQAYKYFRSDDFSCKGMVLKKQFFQSIFSLDRLLIVEMFNVSVPPFSHALSAFSRFVCSVHSVAIVGPLIVGSLPL